MQYERVVTATFLRRPNRFLAQVRQNGAEHTVHVKNTGRCRELLLPGATVFLAEAANPHRKTAYDLIAVRKERPGAQPLLINIDSQIANDVAAEWLPVGGLFSSSAQYRREVRYGNSRFDLSIEDQGRTSFLEVKGVTLERDGIALFPDAPTERGVKHLKELIAAKAAGYGAYLLFVIQMQGIRELRPNDETHRAFGDTLRLAHHAGVEVLAMDCSVTESSIHMGAPASVTLFS